MGNDERTITQLRAFMWMCGMGANGERNVRCEIWEDRKTYVTIGCAYVGFDRVLQGKLPFKGFPRTQMKGNARYEERLDSFPLV